MAAKAPCSLGRQRESRAHCVGDAAQERFDNRAGWKDQGGTTLVLDLAEVFERVSLPVVWAWAEHQERVQFEGYVAETITSVLPGSK